MNSLKTFTTAILLVVIALFWTSCKKEIAKDNSQPTSTDDMTLHTRGAVADDPARIEKLSTIVSSDYLRTLNQPEQSTARRAKPGADGIPPTVSITSPASGT